MIRSWKHGAWDLETEKSLTGHVRICAIGFHNAVDRALLARCGYAAVTSGGTTLYSILSTGAGAIQLPGFTFYI